MVTAFIFAAHFVFSLYIFSKKWQDENLKSAFLNLALILILFSIGWSIATIIAKLFMEPDGLGRFYNRDDFSLTILSIGEFFFYRFYYKEDGVEGDNELIS